ncbi:MAG: mechanosensitive ion channel family protein [Pikeienuella sp.]
MEDIRAVTRRLAACLAACLLVGLWLAPVAVAQQSPLDYQRLLGATSSTGADDTASGAQQSRPVFDPSSVPDGASYGALSAEPTDPAEPNMLGRIQVSVVAFQERLYSVVVRAPDAMAELWTTLEIASKTGEPSYFIGVLLFALVLLALGRAVSNLFASFIARPLFVNLQKPNPIGYRDKLPVAAYRVMLTGIGTILGISTASAVGLFYHDGDEATLNTVVIIFACYAAFLMIDTIWRMILCPFLPNYRIPAISTSEARRLYRWLYVVSGFGVITIGFGYWLAAMDLPRELLVLFSVSLSGIMVAGIFVMLRTNAKTISRIILDGQPRSKISWVTVLALNLWAPFAVVYLMAAWGKYAVDMVMGTKGEPLGLTVPYLVALGGTLIYAIANYVIERCFERSRHIKAANTQSVVAEANEAAFDAPPPLEIEMRREDFGSSGDIDGDGSEEGSAIRSHQLIDQPPRFVFPNRGMRSFEELARRVASLFAIGAGAYGLLYYWGGEALFKETMLLGVAEDVIDLAFFGYVLFHAIRIWIDRKIAEETADAPEQEMGEGEGGTGASRLATLLPLVRSFVLGIIVIAIFLAVAAETGLNVAPLFAGAGILGLAIGFGSQTLVRDILSGAFFLLDDAFRRGEYIDVGEVKGTVEKISLRSFQLRHHLGMLHTIPFGEISHLTNYSRDWVMMKLPLRLTYDTDVERVRKLVKKLGQELLEDPVIGEKFLQPLKSQGVIEMQDSAMIVRVKFMTRPGEQWVIRKRVFQEIRELFEREGIKFAHREVTVRIPDLERRDVSDTERQAVGAATRNALDVIEGEQALAMAGGPRGPVDDR